MKDGYAKKACFGIIASLITLIPLMGETLCLKDCEENATYIKPSQQNIGSIGYMADSVRYRERSHDTGDVKNSVMGDMNIKVGHEKLDINIGSNTRQTNVDASISSTIILGDMKK